MIMKKKRVKKDFNIELFSICCNIFIEEIRISLNLKLENGYMFNWF